MDEEQVWDNFAFLKLGSSLFCLLPQPNLKRIKCVGQKSFRGENGEVTALKIAIMKFTNLLCSNYPQFTAEVLLEYQGVIVPEKNVRLAIQNRYRKFSVKTADGTRWYDVLDYYGFFIGSASSKDYDVACVHISPAIASVVHMSLNDSGLNVPFPFLYAVVILYHIERSNRLVVFITREFLERADNPLSEVADALEIGFKKGSGSVIPVILASDLLNVNNWPCRPFSLHQLPFIDFSTERKRNVNFKLLKECLGVERAEGTEDNIFNGIGVEGAKARKSEKKQSIFRRMWKL